MSSPAPTPPPDIRALRRRVLDLYDAVTILMLVGIGVLVLYCISLGALTSPGAQQSFGYALALMFLMSALIVHLVDRTYRVWPLGRRISPTPPGPVSARSQARFVLIVIFVAGCAAIAYILGGLIA